MGYLGISPKPLRQFDRVVARFSPLRLDNLRSEALGSIGRVLLWEAMWRVEGGPYRGHWAMGPVDGGDAMGFTWTPDCNLELVGEG